MQKKIDIQQFSMLRLIGKGAYGKVFIARKKENNKVYAIKALKKKKFDKNKQIQQIMTEKCVLTLKKHQFIVSLSYTFQNEKHFYFAMEYCPGGDLYTLLSRKQKLSEDKTQFYIVLIILALEHLHSQNIIYRDLKPENVLLDKQGYIKLSDFGLSKIMNDTDKAYSISGTPEYLAPEILKKMGYDYKVDCWSLGCLLYEMVVGLPPFYSDKRADLINKIENELPNLNFPMSSQVKNLIESLLEKQPENRMSIHEVKGHEWFNNIDWDEHIQLKRVAPFLPNLQGEDDTSYFDKEFTEQELFNSPNEGYSSGNIYYGFSGNNSFQ